MARTRKNLRGGQPQRKKAKLDELIEAAQKVEAAEILTKMQKEDLESEVDEPVSEPVSEPRLGKRGRDGRQAVPSTDRPVPVPCPSDIMKFHLKADMSHDHGAARFNYENEDFAILYGGNQGGIQVSIGENEALDYIRKNDPFAIDRDFRVNNILTFRQDERTEVFSQDGGSVFKPFINVDNSKVAVLQDAGVQLFRAIGAQNLITFGSILDQAGKPVEKDDKPVFFNYTGSIEIDPCIYGFNPDVVQNKITIDKFNGKHARCVFNYKYKNEDTKIGGTNGLLYMNRRGGDFMSNKEVKNKPNHTSAKMGAYIGKALGDILLVASITKKIGNVENKFLSKELQFLHEADKTISVERFLLNTGDQLNHARAFMFGVDSVYSLGRDGIRTFEYIPGVNQKVLTPAETKIMYLQRIKDLIIQIDTAYGTFIKHLKTEVIKDNQFDSNKSSKCGDILITQQPSIQRAKRVIEYLIDVVEVYRTYVLFYLLVCYKHFEIVQDNEGLKNAYEILLHKSAGLMPSATTTMNATGRDIRSTVTILKTDYLYFSEYTIKNTNTDIKYSDQYNILFGIGDPPSKEIPKQKVDKLMAEINPNRVKQVIINEYPIVSLYGGLSKTHTFYVSDVYQLIGKNQKFSSPSSNIFWTFQFKDKPTNVIPPDVVGRGRDLMVGGQFPESIEVFAQTFNRPQKSFDSIGVLTPPSEEYCSDLLIDFLKENTIEQLVGAVQTYKDNEYSIIDTILLRSVYTDYKNARTSLLPLMTPTENKDALPVLPEFPKEGEFGKQKDKHTKESLLFNAFACRYNGDLIRADNVPLPLKNIPIPKTLKREPSDLEDLLDKYVSNFKELATVPLSSVGAKGHINEEQSFIIESKKQPDSRSSSQARSVNFSQAETLSLGTTSPFSQGSLSPIYEEGGQRVPVENLYMDWTKSFVRRGGSSFNSADK